MGAKSSTSGRGQRTSAAPPGQMSVNLCIPLSSLLITYVYVRTIERRREIFILATTPNGRIHTSQLTDARLTIAIVVPQRTAICAPKSGMRITVPRSDCLPECGELSSPRWGVMNMPHGSPLNHDFPYRAKGNKVTERLAELSTSIATSRQQERGSDQIMEALLREYLKRAPL